MAKAGRPRLTAEDYQARLASYCARYGVQPTPEGIPPFPAGQRETAQHREWIKLYKAHDRLARRGRNQCERCGSPTSAGSIFCEGHRAASPAGTGDQAATAEERRDLLAAQKGLCPICTKPVGIGDAMDHRHRTGQLRGLVHRGCSQLLAFAEALGPAAVDNARRYLWTGREVPTKRRRQPG